ncbi:unnamed protein product [Trichobilharzia szidati]|nr:unnamed protein product [Trichobilharzia szidati]
MSYQTIQQKKQFTSARYRTYSNNSNELDEATSLLEKLNMPQLDEQCETINNGMNNLRKIHHEMRSVYQQFTHTPLYEDKDDDKSLAHALVKLRKDLESYSWKLERSFRYKMNINLLSNTTSCGVELFNRMNQLCSEIIKSSDNLRVLILSYSKTLLTYKSNFMSAAQFRFKQSTPIRINDTMQPLDEEAGINYQIDRIRSYRSNVNNSRILLNEVEKINQRIRMLFKNLLKETADYLIISNCY